MTQLAFSEMEHVTVSDIELLRKGKSYTYDTLCLLKEKYPEACFYLCVGTDMLQSFETWYQSKKIAQMCTLAVASRHWGDQAKIEEKAAFLQTTLEAQVKIVELDVIDISSTELRTAAAKGMLPGLIPAKVWHYIKEKNLYGM